MVFEPRRMIAVSAAMNSLRHFGPTLATQQPTLGPTAHWAIWSALSDYRHKLRAWLTAELRRLVDAYESQVAPIRARLASETGGEDSAPAANEQVVADLECLRSLLPRAKGAAALASPLPASGA